MKFDASDRSTWPPVDTMVSLVFDFLSEKKTRTGEYRSSIFGYCEPLRTIWWFDDGTWTERNPIEWNAILESVNSSLGGNDDG